MKKSLTLTIEGSLSFANKWCGKFKNKITSKKLAGKRYQYLLKKYLSPITAITPKDFVDKLANS